MYCDASRPPRQVGFYTLQAASSYRSLGSERRGGRRKRRRHSLRRRDPARPPEEAKVALRSMWKIDPKAFFVVGAIFLGAMAFFFLFFVAVIVWVSLA